MREKFHTKLAIWFALALAVMFSVAYIAYVAFTQAAEGDAAAVHADAVIDNFNNILVEAGNLEVGTYGYLVTHDAPLLEPFIAGKVKLGLLLQTLKDKVRDSPAQVERVADVGARLESLTNSLGEIISAHDRDGLEAAASRLADERFRKEVVAVRSLIFEMINEQDKLLEARIAESRRARNLALVTGASGVLVSVLIIAVIFALIRREGLRRIAAQMELSAANERLSSSLARADALLQEKQLLDQLIALLHSCKSIEEAKDVVSKVVRRALPDSAGAVYLFKSSRNALEVLSQWNNPQALELERSFAPEDCWALRRGAQHAMLTPDDIACAHVDSTKIRAAVCTPMIAHGEVIGIIYLETASEELAAPVLDLLRRFSDEIGMSLTALRLQETLRHQALHDPLTGLFNRRYAENAIPREVSRAKRQSQTLAFLMLDIDHFKRINDRYGHAGGDMILAGVARVLRNGTRVEDIVCRYGGEEFLVMLINADANAAQERAEALRKAVEELVVVLNNAVSVQGTTISLGIACYHDHAESWEDAIRRADGALYAAKEQGRNRVVLAD